MGEGSRGGNVGSDAATVILSQEILLSCEPGGSPPRESKVEARPHSPTHTNQ